MPRQSSQFLALLGVASLLFVFGLTVLAAPSDFNYRRLLSFGEPQQQGTFPRGRLIQATNRKLYGVTLTGGTNNGGTVFTMNLDGSEYQIIHSFDRVLGEGTEPQNGLLEGSDGNLYGTTGSEGAHGRGGIFRVGKDGSGFVTLHQFGSIGADGNTPIGALIEGSDGAVFGVTAFGGSGNPLDGGVGTIFRLEKDGSNYTILFRFASGSVAYIPTGSLIEADDGMLYGGTFGDGTGDVIYRIGKDGTDFGVLFAFPYDYPYFGSGDAVLGDLCLGRDRAIYGTTTWGGTNDQGVVFRIDLESTNFTVLHKFSSEVGDVFRPKSGVMEATDGVLYGVATKGGPDDSGGIFRMERDGTGYMVLHYFSAGDSDPLATDFDWSGFAGLIEADDGAIYGTTLGGTNQLTGYVYRCSKDGETLSVIRSFPGDPGFFPDSQLCAGQDGSIYVATGGDFNTSVPSAIVRIMLDGSSTILKILPLRNRASRGLVEASDGMLYGMAYSNPESPKLFRVRRDGAEFKVIGSFQFYGPPSGPVPLMEGRDGLLYGAAASRLFKLNSEKSAAEILHYFLEEVHDLIQGKDGQLYGTTFSTNASSGGTIFRVQTNGQSFQVLHSFTSIGDGKYPTAGLCEGVDGSLYGTTSAGGAQNQGVLFSVTSSGNYATLREFCTNCTDGAVPLGGLRQGPDGALYGTTSQGGAYGNGTLFKIDADGSSFEVVYQFGSQSLDGQNPQASLVFSSNQAFYGTTRLGGAYGVGTVFALFPIGTLITDSPGRGSLSGPSGWRWNLQRSEQLGGLGSWASVTNLTIQTNSVQYVDPEASAKGNRFYRAVAIP